MFRGIDEVNWNLNESVDFQRFFEAKELSPAPEKKPNAYLAVVFLNYAEYVVPSPILYSSKKTITNVCASKR
jgi:hypothetical protein